MEERFEAKYPADAWKNEIDKIIALVKSGNSSQILGMPGVGRSNLLGLLAYNRATRQLHLGQNEYKEFHFVLMNFSEMRKKEYVEVVKFFFVSIIDSLKERKMDEEAGKIQNLLKEALEIPDKQVILQNLKKTVDFLAIEKDLSLIFLIDKFEEYIPSLTSEFFTDLRALRNRAKYKFSVIFSLNRSIEETLESEIYIDFYEFLEGNDIYLPLREETTLKFRIKFLQENSEKKLLKENLDEILYLTAGHGKLTRLAIEACLSEEVGNKLSDFLLSKNKIKIFLTEIWQSLNPEEQNFLISGGEVPSYLEKINLVSGRKIAIRLFEYFINLEIENLTASTSAKIEYDQALDQIKQGEKIISENLTSSEFKLLRFFVENPEKILGRDEAISAVWSDLSSTIGVSEQALDQLVFRLRKKIEENPNNPTHILTIKGRGFKFIP